MMLCLEQGGPMATKRVVCVKVIGYIKATLPCYLNGEAAA